MIVRFLLIVVATAIAALLWYRFTVYKCKNNEHICLNQLAYLLISAGALCRLILAVQIPIGEAPDELAHYNYIASVSQDWNIPVQKTNVITGADTHDYEYYQPPAYYFVLGVVRSVVVGLSTHSEGLTFLIVRLFQLLFWCITAWFSYLIAKKFWASWPLFAVLLLSLVSLLPTFIYQSASINNGNLATALAMVLIYLLLHQQSWLNTVLLGIFSGLALLSKLTATGVVLIAGFVMLYKVVTAKKDKLRWLYHLVLIVILAGLIITPWIVFNLNVYGSLTGEAIANAPNSVIENLDWYERPLWALGHTSHTFWAVAGRKNEFAWLPQLGAVLSIVVLAGLILKPFFSGEKNANKSDVVPKSFVLSSLVALGVQMILLLRMGILYGQAQGRFLFAMFVPLAIVAAIAISNMLRLVPCKVEAKELRIEKYVAGFFLLYGLTYTAYVFGLFL